MTSKITLKEDLVIPAGTVFYLTSESKIFEPHYCSDLGFGAKDSTVGIVVHGDFFKEKPELFELLS